MFKHLPNKKESRPYIKIGNFKFHNIVTMTSHLNLGYYLPLDHRVLNSYCIFNKEDCQEQFQIFSSDGKLTDIFKILQAKIGIENKERKL